VRYEKGKGNPELKSCKISFPPLLCTSVYFRIWSHTGGYSGRRKQRRHETLWTRGAGVEAEGESEPVRTYR